MLESLEKPVWVKENAVPWGVAVAVDSLELKVY